MLRYSFVLGLTFLKRWWIWTLAAIFVFVYLLVESFIAKSSNESGLSNSIYTNFYEKLIVYLFTFIFLTFLTIHIFKSGVKNGFNLLMISKPLTRKRMIFGQIITVLALLFVLQMFIFVVFLLSGPLDKYANGKNVFLHSISLTIGNTVVSICIVAILTILSTVLNSIALSGVSMFLAVLFPIISVALVTVASGNSYQSGGGMTYPRAVIAKKDKSSYQIGDATLLYPSSFNDESNTNSDKTNALITKPTWQTTYKKLAPIDIWNQWASIYSIVQKDDYTNIWTAQTLGFEQKLISTTKEDLLIKTNDGTATQSLGIIIPLDNGLTSTTLDEIQNSKTFKQFKDMIFDPSSTTPGDFKNVVISLLDSNQFNIFEKAHIVDLLQDDFNLSKWGKSRVTVSGVVATPEQPDAQELIDNLKKIFDINYSNNVITRGPNNKNKLFDSTRSFRWTLKDFIEVDSLIKIAPEIANAKALTSDEITKTGFIFDVNQPVANILSPKPWLNTSALTGVWVMLSIILFLGSSFLNLRRDIK